jgi:hypothetical protein
VEDWQAFLSERPIGIIATVGRDGIPHAVPVEVLVHEGRVWVWCESFSVKARNATREGRAAIVAYKGHEAVLVRGSVEIVRRGEGGYDDVVAGFRAKYAHRNDPHENDTLIGLSPDRITAM